MTTTKTSVTKTELKKQLTWLKNAKRLVEFRDTEHHLIPYYEQGIEALEEQIRHVREYRDFTERQWAKKFRW